MIESEPIQLRPIGIVRREDDHQIIRVDPAYADGLLGIERAEKLQILYWMHKLPAEKREILTAHPRGDASRELRGVFALRSPMRPNPIGSTVVELLEVRGHSLLVEGLDALDGSPVLDVKITS